MYFHPDTIFTMQIHLETVNTDEKWVFLFKIYHFTKQSNKPTLYSLIFTILNTAHIVLIFTMVGVQYHNMYSTWVIFITIIISQ